jgi:hypothetical protein
VAMPSSELEAYPPVPLVTSHSFAKRDKGSSVIGGMMLGVAIVAITSISPD